VKRKTTTNWLIEIDSDFGNWLMNNRYQLMVKRISRQLLSQNKVQDSFSASLAARIIAQFKLFGVQLSVARRRTLKSLVKKR